MIVLDTDHASELAYRSYPVRGSRASRLAGNTPRPRPFLPEGLGLGAGRDVLRHRQVLEELADFRLAQALRLRRAVIVQEPLDPFPVGFLGAQRVSPQPQRRRQAPPPRNVAGRCGLSWRAVRQGPMPNSSRNRAASTPTGPSNCWRRAKARKARTLTPHQYNFPLLSGTACWLHSRSKRAGCGERPDRACAPPPAGAALLIESGLDTGRGLPQSNAQHKRILA